MTTPRHRPAGKKLTADLNTQWASVSISPWSFARLRMDINPLFPAGAIVALSNELKVTHGTPIKPNPYTSQRGGQGSSSEKLDASAQVKIHVWHKEVTVTPRLSIDGGRKAGSIQAQHLIHAITNESAPTGGWPTSTPVRLNIPKNDGTIYTTVKVPHPNASEGVKLQIDSGIVGVVMKAMTGTNYLRTEEQRAVSKRKDWYYVIQVGVQQTEWKWVQYGNWISVSALEPLHPQDPAAVAFHNHIVSTEGQANLKVVSATIPRNAH